MKRAGSRNGNSMVYIGPFRIPFHHRSLSRRRELRIVDQCGAFAGGRELFDRAIKRRIDIGDGLRRRPGELCTRCHSSECWRGDHNFGNGIAARCGTNECDSHDNRTKYGSSAACYSVRNALNGSTLAARRAGSALEAITTPAIPSTASK